MPFKPLRLLRPGKVSAHAVHHPVFARYYARFSTGAETRMGIGRLRERLLAGLSGRVIEIGAGNGLNFAHYPGTVSEVVAIEPERLLRQLAVEAAMRCEVPVDVAPGAAEALPVKSEAYDAAVLSLVLCSVRDVPKALAEVRRVLRPGGTVRFFEHGRGGGRVMRSVQRVWTPRCGRGCAAAVTWLATRSPHCVRRGSNWARTVGCCCRRRDHACPRRTASWAPPVGRSTDEHAPAPGTAGVTDSSGAVRGRCRARWPRRSSPGGPVPAPVRAR